MNIGVIIVIAIAGIWALGVFLGAIGGFTKTFSHTPSALDSSVVKDKEEQTIQETKDKQDQLMQDMKQKMEDSSHRY